MQTLRNQRVSFVERKTRTVFPGMCWSRDSGVGQQLGHKMDGGGVWDSTVGMGKRFFSSPKRSDWLWGPPSLLFNG